MLKCSVCGNGSFENQDGFMYCTECQTQSQEYCEIEYEHTEGVTKRTVKTKKVKKVAEELSELDCWTTWEAFNFILYGMTQQLKELGAPDDIDTIVLKLWACYLNRCEVAFTSRVKEEKPKLGFAHHSRDARVVYSRSNLVDLETPLKRKRSRSTSRSTTASSAKRLKSRIVDSDYEAHSSSTKIDILGNETIESISRASDTEPFSDSSGKSSAKNILKEKDIHKYNDFKRDPTLKKCLKVTSKHESSYINKRKLIAILHLALLLSDSEIQLSDLLRFIREGHLSYAKVTHFFPEGIRFTSGDFSYIECLSDVAMPSHMHQRKLAASVASLLDITAFSSSNAVSLIKRYCFELNLPGSIFNLSERVFEVTKLGRKTNNAGFEALAMAAIIFAMKLLFGLDGTTELLLSDFAAKVNGTCLGETEKRLFVFRDWQRHLECRKAAINRFHYPTREQLTKNCFESSKNFMDVVMKESRDEYKSTRFKINPGYLMDRKFLEAVKKTATALTEPQVTDSLSFPPSLTPQRTYLDIILEAYSRTGVTQDSEQEEDGEGSAPRLPVIQPSVLDALKKDFEECDTDFVRQPEVHVERLRSREFNVVNKSEFDLFIRKRREGTGTWPEKGRVRENGFDDILTDRLGVDVEALSLSRTVICMDTVDDYWIMKCPAKVRTLKNFNSKIVSNTSKNFQWLLLECSRMLEMNAKDLYAGLLVIETKMLRFQETGPTSSSPRQTVCVLRPGTPETVE